MQSAARPSRGAPATGPASDTRNTYGTEREKESDKKCGKEAEDPFGKKLKQSPDFFPGNENGRASLEEIAVPLHRLRRVSTSVGSQSPSGPSLPTRLVPFRATSQKLQTFSLQMSRCRNAADISIANVEVFETLQTFYCKSCGVGIVAESEVSETLAVIVITYAMVSESLQTFLFFLLQTSRCRMLQTFYHRRRGVRDATDIPF